MNEMRCMMCGFEDDDETFKLEGTICRCPKCNSRMVGKVMDDCDCGNDFMPGSAS